MQKNICNSTTEKVHFSKLKLLNLIRIFFCFILLLLLIFQYGNAQPWQQLGPGAGGQERAVYMHKNVAGNYVLYVGSDVSGVWRSSGINPNDIVNPNQFQYKYISNHELTRFINKFCRPTAYTSDYLFVANRSGIDRIDLKNENNPMQNVLLNSEYWISDIFICKSNPANSLKHKSYAITGNTRIDQEEKSKPLTTFDFYEFDLGQDELSYTNLKGYDISNFTSTNRNIYALFCDDNNSSTHTDDKFIVGTDKGLYDFIYTDLNGTTVNANYVAGPPGVTSDYIVSSILKTDVDKYLVTIYGVGLYLYQPGTGTIWTNMITTLGVTNTCNNIVGAIDDIPVVRQFTKVLPVKNPTSGTLEGFLLVHTRGNVDLPSFGNTYVGLYYSGQSGGQPDGNWCALRANSFATNDYGWNASKPCANPNGILLTDNNFIITGKQGNIFISQNPLNATTYSTMLWQQIYTTASAPTADCPVEEYNHSGYVNMATNVVFPETTDKIWTTARDRLFWLDDGPGNSFSEIIPGNTNTDCYSLDLTTTNSCGVNTSSLSDAFFMQREGNFLYAGIAEGFAANMGLGYVIKNDHTITTNKVWTVEGNAICGDPLKFFIINGTKYVLVKPSPNASFSEPSLLYLNVSGVWTVVPNFPTTGIRDVDMITISGVNHYFVIANSGAGSQTIYHFTGDLTNSPALVCTKANAIASYNFERLKILPFNSAADFKVIIGSSPADPPLNNITYFHELNSSNTCSLTTVPVSNTIFQNLHIDKIDNVDEGVTAIEVNTVREIIYVATVSFDATQTVQVKSHLYKTTYDATGAINPIWTEITGNAPNKTFTYLNSNNSSSNCNEQYVYACVRGLGAWKFEENPVLITTSNDVVCSGATNASITASNPFGGTATYLWSNLQATQTATGLGAGTYTVTVTSTSSTCTSSATIVISEDPNCCNTHNQYLYEADFNSGIISGDWNLNESVTCAGSVNIINANISIRQGVSITIPSGVTVTVDGSTLFACGNMWHGFVVEDGGTLIVINGTVIKDAIIGATVNAGASISCINATYDHNYVGIAINDLQNGIQTGNVTVEGSTFSCVGCLTGNPLKQSYPGSVSTGMVSRAGIQATNSLFNIGVSGGTENLFTELYHGIDLFKCQNIIVNSRFANMPFQNEYIELPTDPSGGIAIFAEGDNTNYLKVFGLGNSIASFSNCYMGVQSSKTSTYVSNAKMNLMEYGIKVSDVALGTISITNIIMETVRKTGILLQFNETAIIAVSDNNIKTNGSASRCISINEHGNASKTRFLRVQFNTLENTSGVAGVVCNNVVAANITYNNITQKPANSGDAPPTAGAAGIEINACDHNIINCNSVTSLFDLIYNGHTGVKITHSSNSNIECNSVLNNYEGFYFGGNDCIGTVFKGNIMGNAYVGLYLNNTAVIDKQPANGTPPYHGNQWTGTYNSAYGAVNMNSSPISNLDLSLFTTDQNIANNNPVIPLNSNDPPFNVNNTQWFDYQNTGSTFACSQNQTCNAYLAGGGEGSQALRILIARDSTLTSEFIPESKIIARLSLLNELVADSVLAGSDTVLTNFKDANQYTAIGYLNRVKNQLTKLGKLSAVDHTTFLSNNGLLIMYADSIYTLDSLVIAGSATDFSQIRLNLINQIIALQAANRALLSSQHPVDSSLIQTATIENNSATTTGIPDANDKIINEVEINYRSNGIASITDNYNSILSVAMQCPYSGGRAVIRARVLAELFNDSIIYDDKNVCLQQGIFRQLSPQLPITSSFLVIPNPASNNTSIVLNQVEKGICNFIIYDNTNRVIMHDSFACDRRAFEFSTANFSHGVYHIVIKLNGHSTHNAKLIIIR